MCIAERFGDDSEKHKLLLLPYFIKTIHVVSFSWFFPLRDISIAQG